ncbi:MAG: exopolysaccharide biosynthesis polyprenyl glycosylphosphotransferase [Actinomycetota bacterium]|nr:exopolysaccharide biosynthesis polyprenyl glycosylphosphotransferase [Actinomycetota bacterium]
MTALEQAGFQEWSAPVLREVQTRVAPEGEGAGRGLRRGLIALDVVAAALGWSIALSTAAKADQLVIRLATLVVLVAAAVAMVAGQRLYLSRVCAIRAVEISGLARASVLAVVAALVLPRALPVELPTETALVGGVLTFVLLNVARAGFRAWLHAGRRAGRFLRLVVIVGANDEAYDLFKLVRDHPETGFCVAAVAGDPCGGVTFPESLPRLDVDGDLAGAVRRVGANGVLVASSSLHRVDLNRHVRAFLKEGLHVHLSSGLRGVDQRRLRSQPVAHEAFFYVERVSLAPWQRVSKRTIDVVLTIAGGIAVAPLLLLAALAVKLEDGGPVLFRQRRVGRDGVEFTILKLRTMVPDAEAMYLDLVATHAGREGPLIKLSDDPRRTRVGRILERLSIDELPQMWNVLRGEMSLVGPRPAQPSEIAAFDEELRGRLAVAPGITGLWQVEARDNPSFSAYRRYDLFYIENWTIALDTAILVATLQRVAMRGLRLAFDRGFHDRVPQAADRQG